MYLCILHSMSASSFSLKQGVVQERAVGDPTVFVPTSTLRRTPPPSPPSHPPVPTAVDPVAPFIVGIFHPLADAECHTEFCSRGVL